MLVFEHYTQDNGSFYLIAAYSSDLSERSGRKYEHNSSLAGVNI